MFKMNGATSDCSDFITDKTLLRATSAYGGFTLCPSLEPNYIHNFLVACLDYYADKNNLSSLENSIIKEINEECIGLEEAKNNTATEEQQCAFINARNILNNSVKRYEMIQDFKREAAEYGANERNPDRVRELTKIYIKKKIADIFTQWIKFILPIPKNTESFLRQTANVLVELMDSKFRDIISNHIGDVYGTLGFSNKSNANNLKKMTNPLKHIVLNMVFYLCTPDDAISFNVNILKKYRIFKNREIFSGNLQDQHNILAIVEELNIKDLESQFSNVYRIPINTLQSEITGHQIDNDLKNVLDGIECIAEIMSTKLEKFNNFPDTAKFRNRLAKTDSSRAAFIFTPTEFMFNEDSFRKPMEFYTFLDLLCVQYLQEYKTGIDIEHIVTSSRLQYMADFAVTFKEDNSDKERNFFNFFLSIFEFALYSRFVQICVTNTCNRSAGDSVRWSKTVDEYKNLLKFVCTLYWAVEKNKMNLKFNYKVGETTIETTIKNYVEQMYTNSDIVHNKETGRKQEFIKFPTMIVPFDFLYNDDKENRLNLTKATKNPLRRNYEFVQKIGMYMNNYNNGMEVGAIGASQDGNIYQQQYPSQNFIKYIFKKRENVVNGDRLEYYLDTGDMKFMEEKSTKKPLKYKEKESDSEFGKTPQPNVLEMFQGLPSIATMERRIQRMDDLLLGIPYQKPLVQRLLEFSESTSKSSISEKRNNEKTKTPMSPSKKASLFSKFFSTNKKVIPSQ
jgi:hypothetical protein